jgi:hypothetical protein
LPCQHIDPQFRQVWNSLNTRSPSGFFFLKKKIILCSIPDNINGFDGNVNLCRIPVAVSRCQSSPRWPHSADPSGTPAPSSTDSPAQGYNLATPLDWDSFKPNGKKKTLATVIWRKRYETGKRKRWEMQEEKGENKKEERENKKRKQEVKRHNKNAK